MRKTVAVLWMAVCLLLMAGCGNDEKVIGGNGQNSDSGNGQGGGQEESTGKGAGEKGYVFYYNGTAVCVDADAAPITEALGEPAGYFEAPSCAFDGIDKKYTYSGFVVDTYPLDGKDYVYAVVLRDDTVQTAEGVCIGDSREKVEQVYGSKDGVDSGSNLVYAKDGMELWIILQDDVVTSIQYKSKTL